MNINELYKTVIKGDSYAETELFSHLYETFTHLLEHRIQDEDDAKDLVQEILAIIAQKYRHISIQTNFGAWTYGIFKNRLKRYYRDKKRTKRLNNEYSDMKMRSFKEPADIELRHRLIECLKKLNSTNTRYVEVLNLHHQGFDAKEISKKMGITRKNIYNILFRARSMLKQCISKSDDGEK